MRAASGFSFLGLIVLLNSCDVVQRSAERVLHRYRIVTPSMSPTLNVGDVHPLVSVDHYEINQVIGFHPPKRFRDGNDKVVYLFRLVGLPGDRLEMKKGLLVLNQKKYPHRLKLKHSYKVETSMPLREKLLEGMEFQKIDVTSYEFFSTPEEIIELKKNKAVKGVESGIYGADYHEHGYEFEVGPNRDNWGPLKVPAKGDKILISEENQSLYKQLIVESEKQAMPSPGSEYVVRKNYFFVLGDNRHNALDSRYMGFVPEDELVGVMDVE